jgi:hypothetical protein
MKIRMRDHFALVVIAALIGVAVTVWAQDPGSNYNAQGGKATVIGGTLTVSSGGAATVASGGSLTVASGGTASLAGTTTVPSGGAATVASGGSLTGASGSTVALGGTNTVPAGGTLGIGGGTALKTLNVVDVTMSSKTGTATITGLSNTAVNLAKTYVSWGWRTNTARDPGKVYFTIPTTGTLTLTSANNTSATATVFVVTK